MIINFTDEEKRLYDELFHHYTIINYAFGENYDSSLSKLSLLNFFKVYLNLQNYMNIINENLLNESLNKNGSQYKEDIRKSVYELPDILDKMIKSPTIGGYFNGFMRGDFNTQFYKNQFDSLKYNLRILSMNLGLTDNIYYRNLNSFTTKDLNILHKWFIELQFHADIFLYENELESIFIKTLCVMIENEFLLFNIKS